MTKIPFVSAKVLKKFLESIVFVITRSKVYHFRLISDDGRITTISADGNK